MTDMTPDEVAEIVAELMPIGGESRQAQALTLYVRAIEQSKLRVIELAYGILWTAPVDTRTPEGLRISLARQALLEHIDRDGQARGITAGREAIALAMLGHSRK